jgi:bacillithiol synthase
MSLPIYDTPLAEPPRFPERREGGWNEALSAALIAAPGAESVHGRLRLPGALVVTSGQQPGLFTGPGYTVSKAFSARALALVLEREWGCPVVPVFWVPGDDHDFDEVASVAWLSGEGDLLRAALDLRSPDGPLASMARQLLGSSVLPALDAFEQSLPVSEARDRTTAWLRRHYRPDHSVAGAFGRAMAELLAPFGIACFDSTHPAAKAAAAPMFLRALRGAVELDQALAARGRELDAAGVDHGVVVGDGASLVFLEDAAGRDRLVAQGEGFVTRRTRQRFSLSDLETLARDEPERLSGNVLLRPAVESFLLPTVAYVAGPGELRYLELTPPVYQHLGVHRQRPVPRWSGLFVEPRVTRILGKFKTSLEELLDESGALEARLAREALPPGTEAAFEGLRSSVDGAYEPVIRLAASIDPTMERPAVAARGQALFGIQELEKKLLQHARKRESTELAQVARAKLSVRPEGKPQERVLSMAGFIGRYGWDLTGALAGHIEAWYARALVAASPTA